MGSRLTGVVSGLVAIAAVAFLPAPSSPSQDAADRAGRLAAADAPTALTDHVLAISIDGLNPRALARLGPESTPHLHRLLAEGASTTQARSQVESTSTLPNHTSMVTGRRVFGWRGGHGILFNDHRPGSRVQQYAEDQPVSSVFEVAATRGSTALFTTKEKFSLFKRSWPAAIDRYLARESDDVGVTSKAVRDIARTDRVLRFVHLAKPDSTGHTFGFLSREYLEGVELADAQVGRLLRAVAADPAETDTVVVLTADHGGAPGQLVHSDVRRYDNYRVPFAVWGPGVRRGDLYDLNPAYASPGRGRPGLGGRQPVRNGDLANVALSVLGLDPVPGSRFGARRPLLVR